MKKIETVLVIAEVKTGKEGMRLEAIISDEVETKISSFADKEHLIRHFANEGWWLRSDKTIKQNVSLLEKQRKGSAIKTIEELYEPTMVELIFQKDTWYSQ